MPIGPAIVLFLRIFLPLLIIKRPLLGIIVSLVIDAIDVVLIDIIHQGNFANYHHIDKYLDTYYLTIAAGVSLFWKNKIAKYTSIFLFIYRLIGVIIFEISSLRIFLFAFPNLFENFFIFVLVYKQFFKKEIKNFRELIIILILLLIPKMIQEYILHFAQVKPWNFIKETFLGIY